MNKRRRNIILLFSLIGILLIANLLVFYFSMDDENLENASNVIYVSNYTVGSLEKIEIENQYGTLTIIADGEEFYALGHEDVMLDQEVVYELAYMLTHITAERLVSDTEDYSNTYGIQSPNAVITTYHQGVVEQKFTIGDLSPIENEYYMQSSVFKSVYTVDLMYYLYGQITINDLMVLKGVEIPHENMVKIKVADAFGQDYTMERVIADNDYSVYYWEFTQPFNHGVDTGVLYGTDEYAGMITALINLSGQKVMGNMESDAAKYGLENPMYTATIFSNINTAQSLKIGDYGDEENYSLAFDDGSSIYSVSKSSVPFVDYSVYILADANLSLIDIEAVKSVEIAFPNLLETKMDITLTKGNNEDAYTVQIDMDEISDDANKNEQMLLFYQDLVTIKIDDIILEEVESAEVIGKITFDLNSKIRDNYTIYFTEYSASHYAAKKSDEDAVYLVSKTEIEDIIKRYEKLLQGE